MFAPPKCIEAIRFLFELAESEVDKKEEKRGEREPLARKMRFPTTTTHKHKTRPSLARLLARPHFLHALFLPLTFDSAWEIAPPKFS